MAGRLKSGNTILGGVALAGFIAAVATAAYFIEPQQQPSGHWPKEHRDAFIAQCTKKCKASPGVTPDRYALCDKACSCGADEAEKIMTPAELAEFYLAQKAGLVSNAQKEKIKRVAQASVDCARRAFGGKK